MNRDDVSTFVTWSTKWTDNTDIDNFADVLWLDSVQVNPPPLFTPGGLQLSYDDVSNPYTGSW